MALDLGFKEWTEFGRREGISLEGLASTQESAKSCSRESKWCHTVAEADEVPVEEQREKMRLEKGGWKYKVRAQMPEKEAMILYCRRWETMEKT